MANILKTNKSYTDVRGVVYTNPYMIVDDFYASETPKPRISFNVRIFKNESARQSGLLPILDISMNIKAPHISSYLNTLKDANAQERPIGFMKKHIYRFLGTELVPIPTIKWSDWKSDEVGGLPQTLNHR